jgi:hypothetical protein
MTYDDLINQQQQEYTKTSNIYLQASLILTVFILLVTVLFKIKTPLQFYVKFAVYSAISILVSIFILPILIFRPNNPKNVK